jgi:hypothetical protein
MADNLSERGGLAMARYVSGSRFGVNAALRVGVFLALTLGFPFIVYGLILATGAHRVGVASGALAAVAGVYLKPIIILVFVISLIGICWRRMRALGLPGFCGLLVPFLLLMDATYLLVVGAHWGTAFSLGTMHVGPPVFAMVAVATMMAMGLALPPSGDAASGQLFRILLWCSAALAVLLVVTALMTSSTIYWIKLVTVSFSGRPNPAALVPSKAAGFAYQIKPFVCVAYCAVIAFMTFLSRRASGQSPGGGEAEPHRPVLSPPGAPSAAAFGKR